MKLKGCKTCPFCTNPWGLRLGGNSAIVTEGGDEDNHGSILFSSTIYGVTYSTGQRVKSGLRVQ